MAAVPARLRFDPLRFSMRSLRFSMRVGSANEMRRFVAEAAYFRAEARRFATGSEVGDWLAAERQIAEHAVIAGPLPGE